MPRIDGRRSVMQTRASLNYFSGEKSSGHSFISILCSHLPAKVRMCEQDPLRLGFPKKGNALPSAHGEKS